tara:strand:+ start:179 stop:412 length:234 start_codon:yes stop_codon:yes gene_type:complete
MYLNKKIRKNIESMKIIEILENVELLMVNLEVNLGSQKRSSPTLCVRYKGKIIPLNTAHDGRPILMNEDNAIESDQN